ncbi:hypothetical protein D3C86_1912140 [compost metagenome]
MPEAVDAVSQQDVGDGFTGPSLLQRFMNHRQAPVTDVLDRRLLEKLLEAVLQGAHRDIAQFAQGAQADGLIEVFFDVVTGLLHVVRQRRARVDQQVRRVVMR